METIYIAGCAWGVQEFLKQLPGWWPKLAELMVDEIH
jgi:peptide methionine sulfoxide reductase MsrA